MTQIGTVTIETPMAYRRAGYSVNLVGKNTGSDEFNQLRELYARAEWGTAVHQVPGARPIGEDLTDDLANTQYCQWTHGTAGKVQDGYYLLLPGHSFVEDETPEGHSYVFSVNLYFIGTLSYYSHGLRAKVFEEETNDWGI